MCVEKLPEVNIELTPHMAGVVERFNHYRLISASENVVSFGSHVFNIQEVMDEQAWMIAVYFADKVGGAA